MLTDTMATLFDTTQQLATSFSMQIVTFSWHCAIGVKHE